MNHRWSHPLIPSPSNAGTDQSNEALASYHHNPKFPGNSNNHQQQSGATLAWDRPGSSSQNWHSKEWQTEDPDGLPYEPNKEDQELTRKRKELQVIQEQIMLKRASLALKTINFKTSSKESKPNNKTLRERVKLILQQRNRCPSGSSRRRSLHVQHDHPLKWRVAAALQQRFVTPPEEPQKCKPLPVPLQKDPSPVKEVVNKSDLGFMRFLNILNKGVDVDKLIEMVNGETGSQSHNCQNVAQTHSATNSFESLPIGRKKLEAEQQCPSTEEQQRHLKNILESLGLSLATDEISRLGDRTQERLYGKRQRTEEEAVASEEKTQTEQQETEGEETYSPGHYTRSSSSSELSSPSNYPLRKQRSSSSTCSRQRSSYSPNWNTDSHLPNSHLKDNTHLQYPPPTQPYPYPTSQYFSPHFPPQDYDNAYSYSVYSLQ